MDVLNKIFSNLFFIVPSGILVLILLFNIVSSAIAFFSGIYPVLFRLGLGLANRKIAVFAASDKFNELKTLLIDSGIFKEKNITPVYPNGDISKKKDTTLLLVYWNNFNKQERDRIISLKKYTDALIVYAPRVHGQLSTEEMKKLDPLNNTILVNFKGRLLNDIVSSMITTAYKKKKNDLF